MMKAPEEATGGSALLSRRRGWVKWVAAAAVAAGLLTSVAPQAEAQGLPPGVMPLSCAFVGGCNPPSLYGQPTGPPQECALLFGDPRYPNGYSTCGFSPNAVDYYPAYGGDPFYGYA